MAADAFRILYRFIVKVTLLGLVYQYSPDENEQHAKFVHQHYRIHCGFWTCATRKSLMQLYVDM